MKSASVTETRNRLSAILDQVKEGETFLILEHGKPVARLEPVREIEGKSAEEAQLADLERRGIVIRHGSGRIPKKLLDKPPIKLPKGESVLKALLEEREEERERR